MTAGHRSDLRVCGIGDAGHGKEWSDDPAIPQTRHLCDVRCGEAEMTPTGVTTVQEFDRLRLVLADVVRP